MMLNLRVTIVVTVMRLISWSANRKAKPKPAPLSHLQQATLLMLASFPMYDDPLLCAVSASCSIASKAETRMTRRSDLQNMLGGSLTTLVSVLCNTKPAKTVLANAYSQGGTRRQFLPKAAMAAYATCAPMCVHIRVYILTHTHTHNGIHLMLGEFKKLQTHLLWKPHNCVAVMSYVRNA